MESEIIGTASPEQIKEWKERNNSVFSITITGHIAYLCNPSKKIIETAVTRFANKPILFNEYLLESCWLGGSNAIKTDDNLFLQIRGKLGEIATQELKRLTDKGNSHKKDSRKAAKARKARKNKQH